MDCVKTGKHIHYSIKKAQTHLSGLRKETGYDGKAYRCDYCNGWHVGRQKKNAKKNKYKIRSRLFSG